MLARHRLPEIDQLILIYLDAIDDGDLHLIGEIWERAETDAELCQALISMNEYLDAQEQQPASAQPPRFCDVARALDGDSALSEQLRSHAEPLPRELSLGALLAWARAHDLPDERAYWQAFKSEAMRLRSQQSSADMGLAARDADKPTA